MEMHASLRDQIANWCRHFNGMQNDRCEIGVLYDVVKGPQGIPCLKGNRCSERCASASFPSPEEVEQEAQRQEQAVTNFLRNMREGKVCPHCSTPIEGRVQIERCVYAHPCGHRLAQGRLP